MASIEIRNARKAYGTFEVLHGVSIDIPDGEFVILVGPSGCGKSTLLRMIAGLESITSGEIAIGNTVVNDLPPKSRDIAMVFQSYALYPHMTVAENMGFSLKLARRGKEEIGEKVGSAADILGLGRLLARKPAHLSGGQRQRVAMGRAIVRDPTVFLFDEPLSNLDAQLRVQMRAEIKSLHQRLKTTIVYVTHDQVEAMTMADRIVVMNDGNVEQVGAPLELFDRPANLFVARFIGSPSMNLLEGRIEGANGSASFVGGGVCLPIGKSGAKPGQEVVLGFRPEHLGFAAPTAQGGLDAEVVVIEPTGTETLLNVNAAGQSYLAVFRERLNVRPGDRVKLEIDCDHIHLFDKETGQRL